MARRLIALLLSALYVVGVVFASLALVRPQAPPVVPVTPVVHGPLTQHLLFVIVDGLRYDIATDPQRMPGFAKAMRERRSARVMAGPVSMTSAAVQNFGSGQPGRLEQIVRNLDPDPVRFDSWLASARRRGLRVSHVGDGTWLRMYGAHVSESRADPAGVSLDYDFTDITFTKARSALAGSPQVLLVHFRVPDQQGHAHGIQSTEYRKYMQHFDAKLFDFLSQVGPEWAVVVTSDHGANDAGDHGGDVLIQRLTPLFAYGTGIAPASAAREPGAALDQTDVAGTLAALLGIAAPAHSQGHLLGDWLAVSDSERAAIELNDVERALAFARTLDRERAEALALDLRELRGRAVTEPVKAIAGARALATDVQALIAANQGTFSPRAVVFLLTLLAGAVLLAWLWMGPLPLSTSLAVGIAALASVVLTAYVEKMPGAWPKRSAGILFAVLNLPTLLLLLKPERFVSLLTRCKRMAPALVPGLLAVTYPRNLQPVVLAVCCIVPLVVLGSPNDSTWGISGLTQTRRGRAIDIALALLWGLAIVPAGWHPSGLTGLGWVRFAGPIFGFGLVLLASFAVELVRRAPHAARQIALLTALVAVSLLARRIAPPWIGRPLIVLLPLLALVPLRRGRLELGVLCLLGGYVWAARDMELVTVLPVAGMASLVLRRCAPLVERSEPARLLTMLAFWFALAFMMRLGVSGGMDPTNLDMAAGAFGDKEVSLRWLGFCVVYKTLVALTLLGLLVLSSFGRRTVSLLARGFAVISVGRVVVLLGMLQLANGSFWTSLRVIGELPYTMIFFVSAGTAWLLRHARPGAEAIR